MGTVYEAERLISGGSALPGGVNAVLVEGALIASIGRSEVLRAAHPNAALRRFPGRSIMPGLINSHVHLAADLSSAPFEVAVSGARDVVRALVRRNARACLRAGCTTVRDLGDTGGVVAELHDTTASKEAAPRPRILSAGAPLTITGGHCWFLGGVADTADELRAAIDGMAGSVDLIKVMAGGGYLTSDGPTVFEAQYPTELLRVVVAHAAQHGLPVAAHAHGTEPIIRCVDAGVATIEHCGWRSGPSRRDQDDVRAATMARERIAAGTTTPVHWRKIADMIADAAGAGAGYRFGGQLTWMAGHGVPILIGTDSGTPAAVFDDVRTSLELFEELGFPLEQILDMLTTSAADTLGLGARTGALRPGLDADLLVVAGDPRTDLDVLHRPELVVTQGVPFTQDQLADTGLTDIATGSAS